MEEKKFDLKEYASVARSAAAEGIVLLKNDSKVLPLQPNAKVALFGRTQFHYYKSGTGSGGLVNTHYVTGIYEAMESDPELELNRNVRRAYEDWVAEHPFDAGKGWAGEPWFQEEMPLSRELVEEAAKESEVAIILLGRTAGEDQDNKAEAGSYLLTETERDMLEKVCGVFERTVVLLNVGNIIDMKWVEKVNPSAVLYVWQGGQEGGNGVLDVCKGTVTPSGRLTDTIAYDINDYFSTSNHGDAVKNIYKEDIYVGYRYFETFAQDKVLYPFGYGLSYTTFSRESVSVEETESGFSFRIRVSNTGDAAGKEAVLLFVGAPRGKLGKAARSLCAFGKTKVLEPGESQELQLPVSKREIASYDDSGITGHKSCYVLEQGDYHFYLGGDVREAVDSYTWTENFTEVVETLQEVMAPVEEFERLRPSEENSVSFEKVPLRTIDPMERRRTNLPEEIPYIGNQGWQLKDVRDGNVTPEEFLGQFDEEELMAIVRGEGMSPAGVTPGVAGAFGGIRDDLRKYGLPKVACADGPSGIRMDSGAKAFAMPNGTCLACSFNEALTEELYEYEGMELRKNHIDTLLGPGMNIHRNPLNGRNFEYFSEDPFVTGKMAVAQLRGMQRYGVTGTIKHLACNNQEFSRSNVDCVISERALREIYLRGYEMAVKEGKAFLVMTSYNRINGIHAASNYDLLTTVLREEWKFDGAVMTDWWAKGNEEGEEGKVGHTAVMVRAQNDIYMVMPDASTYSVTDTSRVGLENGTLTRGELLRSAGNICNVLLKLPALQFALNEKTELDRQLEVIREQETEEGELQEIYEDETFTTELTLDTSKGATNRFQFIGHGGVYRITMECCVDQISELAQVPVSVFSGHYLLKTITLNGKDTEWRTEVIEPVVSVNDILFLDFYFGQSGMKIRSCKLERVLDRGKLMERIAEFRDHGED